MRHRELPHQTDPLHRFTALIRRTVTRFVEDRASLLSGAIAYFTLLSLAPLLVVAVFAGGLFFGAHAARTEVVEDLTEFVGHPAAELVAQLATRARIEADDWGTAALGIAVTLFGASRVFMRLQDALNQVWGVRRRASVGWRRRARAVVAKRLPSFGVMLLVGILMIASLVLKTLLGALADLTQGAVLESPLVWQTLELVGSMILVGLFTAVIYRFLPDVVISWRDVVAGAASTSVLLTLGTMVISAYLTHFAIRSLSGAAGSVIVLMLWIYYMANVFFFGAALTRSWAEERGHVVEPEAHAEQIPSGRSIPR